MLHIILSIALIWGILVTIGTIRMIAESLEDSRASAMRDQAMINKYNSTVGAHRERRCTAVKEGITKGNCGCKRNNQ